MPSGLETPGSTDDLYFARGQEVDCFRPFLQGDVLRGVDIPGVDKDEGDEDRLAMVMTHPCSMRQGPRLAPHLHAVRVRKCERPVPIEKWASGYFRIMPLPSLFQEQGESGHEAQFDTLGRIRSDALRHEGCIACLSEEGLALLQQRFVHSLTRVAVPKYSIP